MEKLVLLCMAYVCMFVCIREYTSNPCWISLLFYVKWLPGNHFYDNFMVTT